jgi:hypothetical protein
MDIDQDNLGNVDHAPSVAVKATEFGVSETKTMPKSGPVRNWNEVLDEDNLLESDSEEKAKIDPTASSTPDTTNKSKARRQRNLQGKTKEEKAAIRRQKNLRYKENLKKKRLESLTDRLNASLSISKESPSGDTNVSANSAGKVKLASNVIPAAGQQTQQSTSSGAFPPPLVPAASSDAFNDVASIPSAASGSYQVAGASGAASSASAVVSKTNQGNNKRGRNNESVTNNEAATKKLKLYSFVIKSDLTVTVIKLNGNGFSMEDFQDLKAQLTGLLDGIADEDFYPVFDLSRLVGASAVFHCADAASRDWLNQAIPNLSNNWLGGLTVLNPVITWKAEVILPWYKQSIADTNVILNRLKKANPGLNTSQWLAWKSTDLPKGGKLFTFGLDESSAAFLQSKNLNLHYLTGSCVFSLAKINKVADK